MPDTPTPYDGLSSDAEFSLSAFPSSSCFESRCKGTAKHSEVREHFLPKTVHAPCKIFQNAYFRRFSRDIDLVLRYKNA